MTITETALDDEAQIRAIVEESVTALREKDASLAARAYDPGTVLFGLAPPLQERGPRVADPGYWRPWLETWAGPVTLDVTGLDIAVSRDVAFCHSLNRMRGTKADGGNQDLWFRSTLGLRKTAAGWKITHEHASTPFYMDGSGRAATDLKPEAGRA
jgi:ketosteroid isomerase-like protein